MDAGVVDAGVKDGELAEVRRDLATFDTFVDHLVKRVGDAALAQLDGAGELVEFMQTFEQSRNKLSLVDHAVIAEAERQNLPTVLCQGNMRRVLTSALSLSRPEAARRVKAAAAVGGRVSMLGEALEPTRPHLAAAQRSGEVSPEKVAIIINALEKVDRRGFEPAAIDLGEQLLADQAPLLPPEDLKTVADRVVDAIDPDGTLPDEQLNADRRHFHLRPTKDGAWAGEFSAHRARRSQAENPVGPAHQTAGRRLRPDRHPHRRATTP